MLYCIQYSDSVSETSLSLFDFNKVINIGNANTIGHSRLLLLLCKYYCVFRVCGRGSVIMVVQCKFVYSKSSLKLLIIYKLQDHFIMSQDNESGILVAIEEGWDNEIKPKAIEPLKVKKS